MEHDWTGRASDVESWMNTTLKDHKGIFKNDFTFIVSHLDIIHDRAIQVEGGLDYKVKKKYVQNHLNITDPEAIKAKTNEIYE